MNTRYLYLPLFITLVLSISYSHAEVPYPPSEGVIGGHVSRATFTSQVTDFEPTDHFETRDNAHPYVFFFTDLKGMTGQRVTHRWEYKGKTIAEKHFDVGAPKWRVWSNIALPPSDTGNWVVYVLNDLNQIVLEQHLNYVDHPQKISIIKNRHAMAARK